MDNTMVHIHDWLAECLTHVGAFDDQGISEDGTTFIVNDGILYRVILERVETE